MAEPLLQPDQHRRLAVALFNRTWELLELNERAASQDDEMLHSAHASRYHWGETGRWPNVAVGEWQCARVYTVLGRPEAALWHARRCLELCQQHGVGDYRLAAAYEGLARAELVAGNDESARQWKAKGLAACAQVAKPEDAAPILADLERLAL